jgi:hypothetical protein
MEAGVEKTDNSENSNWKIVKNPASFPASISHFHKHQTFPTFERFYPVLANKIF